MRDYIIHLPVNSANHIAPLAKVRLYKSMWIHLLSHCMYSYKEILYYAEVPHIVIAFYLLILYLYKSFFLFFIESSKLLNKFNILYKIRRYKDIARYYQHIFVSYHSFLHLPSFRYLKSTSLLYIQSIFV